jgi:hypothetical protein
MTSRAWLCGKVMSIHSHRRPTSCTLALVVDAETIASGLAARRLELVHACRLMPKRTKATREILGMTELKKRMSIMEEHVCLLLGKSVKTKVKTKAPPMRCVIISKGKKKTTVKKAAP